MLTLQVRRGNGSKNPRLTAFLCPFASNWRDRNDIYWARREGLYEKPPGRGDHKSFPGPGERFVNFDAFSAKLISSPYKSAVGSKAMAWSQLSRLLEEDGWNLSSLHDERSRNTDEKGALMCLDNKATMQYILHAASELRDESGQVEKDNRYLPAERGVWKGSSAGFTLERWDFWKRRLQILAESGGLDSETDGIVKEALTKMG